MRIASLFSLLFFLFLSLPISGMERPPTRQGRIPLGTIETRLAQQFTPIPSWQPITINQVIELKSINVMLFALSAYINWHTGEPCFHEQLDRRIIQNLDHVDRILHNPSIAPDGLEVLTNCYALLQILSLAGFLPTEPLPEAEHPLTTALSLAYQNPNNTHPCLTIAEQFIIQKIDELFEQQAASTDYPANAEYITTSVMAILLVVCKKFLCQLYNIVKGSPSKLPRQEAAAYVRFRRTPEGQRSLYEIKTTGIKNPLERYRGNRAMGLTIKIHLLNAEILNISAYPHLDRRWLKETAESIHACISEIQAPFEEAFPPLQQAIHQRVHTAPS